MELDLANLTHSPEADWWADFGAKLNCTQIWGVFGAAHNGPVYFTSGGIVIDGRISRPVREAVAWLRSRGYGSPAVGSASKGPVWAVVAAWPEALRGREAGAGFKRALEVEEVVAEIRKAWNRRRRRANRVTQPAAAGVDPNPAPAPRRTHMKSKRATLPRSSTADWWARHFGSLHFTLLWGVSGDDADGIVLFASDGLVSPDGRITRPVRRAIALLRSRGYGPPSIGSSRRHRVRTLVAPWPEAMRGTGPEAELMRKLEAEKIAAVIRKAWDERWPPRRAKRGSRLPFEESTSPTLPRQAEGNGTLAQPSPFTVRPHHPRW